MLYRMAMLLSVSVASPNIRTTTIPERGVVTPGDLF